LAGISGLLLGLTACDGRESTAPSAAETPAPQFASSRKPLIQDFTAPFEFTLGCPQGFTLINAGIAEVHQITFYDAQGEPARTQAHFRLRGTLTNSVSGASLPNRASFTVFTNLVTGVTTVTGAPFHLTAPGRGIVVQDAGRITFDAEGNVVFEAGRHDLIDADFEAAACEALS
jgi:hypothetical protein